MNNTKGQIPVGYLVAGAVSLVIAMVTGFIGQANITQSKIDVVKTDASVVVQRVATLEEAIKTIKENNVEMKADIKSILKLLK